MAENSADRPMEPTPMAATVVGGKRRPNRPSAMKPAKGRMGMSHSSASMSAFHLVGRIGVQRWRAMVEFQQQGQSHRHLGGSHGQDEQKHHLPVRLAPKI